MRACSALVIVQDVRQITHLSIAMQALALPRALAHRSAPTPRQAQRSPSCSAGVSSRHGSDSRSFAHVARPAIGKARSTLQPLCARPPSMRDAEGNVNQGQMLVFVPPHPLIKHWLAIARNEARCRVCDLIPDCDCQ